MTELEKPLPRLKKRSLSRAQKRQLNSSKGFRAETKAIRFLQRTGSYRVLDRNIMVGRSEVDIVALDTTTHELVFIEVKYRQNNRYGSGADAVHWKKIQSLSRVAGAYTARKQLNHLPFRFDVIAITSGTIAHYQNITWP